MNEETYSLPQSAAPANHGRTAAAWTLMVVVVAGAVIVGLGMVSDRLPVTVAGIVVLAGGIIAGLSMRGLGKGQPVTPRQSTDWYASEPQV